jgi:hypothetical protein
MRRSMLGDLNTMHLGQGLHLPTGRVAMVAEVKDPVQVRLRVGGVMILDRTAPGDGRAGKVYELMRQHPPGSTRSGRRGSGLCTIEANVCPLSAASLKLRST